MNSVLMKVYGFIGIKQARLFCTDFQGAPGVAVFNMYVKLGDSRTLVGLLMHSPLIQKHILSKDPLLVHDVGGADGEMMLNFLRILNIPAKVSVNEPHRERRIDYEKRMRTHPALFHDVKIDGSTIEDESFTPPPQRDLILASHVFYYNQPIWLTTSTLKGHLFTKLFESLRVNGLLCVILQQSVLSAPRSHELWEDFFYYFIEHIKHGKNKFYTCATAFDLALSNYRKQFIVETGESPDWVIRENVAKTSVPVGKIGQTFKEDGKYKQTPEVLAMLDFYLKRHPFEKLSVEMQKRVIDIFLQHFTKDGHSEVIHYNKVYTIELKQGFFSALSKLPRANESTQKKHHVNTVYTKI